MVVVWYKREQNSVHVRCQNPKYGPRYLQKRKRRSDSIRSNKFIECNDSPELNWSIELKLEASPTDPREKQMTDQEIWIQHAAMNSLNAVFGQKDVNWTWTNFRGKCRWKNLVPKSRVGSILVVGISAGIHACSHILFYFLYICIWRRDLQTQNSKG